MSFSPVDSAVGPDQNQLTSYDIDKGDIQMQSLLAESSNGIVFYHVTVNLHLRPN